MKKNTLMITLALVFILMLSSCGLMLHLTSAEEGKAFAAALSNGNQDIKTLLSISPNLEQWSQKYLDSEAKKAKAAVFLADMIGKAERQQPGSTVVLLTMMQSEDKRQIAQAMETAAKMLDEQIMKYAGTLEPEKVLAKVFAEY